MLLASLLLASLAQYPTPTPAPWAMSSRAPQPAGYVVWNQCGTYASGAPVRRGTPPTVVSAGDSATCDSGATPTAGANALACTESGCRVITNVAVSLPFAKVTAAAGVIGVCFKGPGTANTRVLGTDGTAAYLYFGDTNSLYFYDGTNFVGPLAYTPNTRTCVTVSWSGSTATIARADGSGSVSGTYRGNVGNTSRIWLGSGSSGLAGFYGGSIERVCQDTSLALVRARCR